MAKTNPNTKINTPTTIKTAARKAAGKQNISEQIQKLIGRKQGATTSTLTKVTGWQAHSIRAALSGLRKKGVAVRRSKNGRGESVYRVEA